MLSCWGKLIPCACRTTDITERSFLSILCGKQFTPDPIPVLHKCQLTVGPHQRQMGLWIPHCACYWVVNSVLHWTIELLYFCCLTSCPIPLLSKIDGPLASHIAAFSTASKLGITCFCRGSKKSTHHRDKSCQRLLLQLKSMNYAVKQ